jgi:hypothetical protein
MARQPATMGKHPNAVLGQPMLSILPRKLPMSPFLAKAMCTCLYMHEFGSGQDGSAEGGVFKVHETPESSHAHYRALDLLPPMSYSILTPAHYPRL